MLFVFSSTTLHIHIVTHIHSWKFPNLASALYYWLLCWNTSAVLHRGSSETRCSKMLLSFDIFPSSLGILTRDLAVTWLLLFSLLIFRIPQLLKLRNNTFLAMKKAGEKGYLTPTENN